jgi:hypothetical protein
MKTEEVLQIFERNEALLKGHFCSVQAFTVHDTCSVRWCLQHPAVAGELWCGSWRKL